MAELPDFAKLMEEKNATFISIQTRRQSCIFLDDRGKKFESLHANFMKNTKR